MTWAAIVTGAATTAAAAAAAECAQCRPPGSGRPPFSRSVVVARRRRRWCAATVQHGRAVDVSTSPSRVVSRLLLLLLSSSSLLLLLLLLLPGSDCAESAARHRTLASISAGKERGHRRQFSSAWLFFSADFLASWRRGRAATEPRPRSSITASTLALFTDACARCGSVLLVFPRAPPSLPEKKRLKRHLFLPAAFPRSRPGPASSVAHHNKPIKCRKEPKGEASQEAQTRGRKHTQTHTQHQRKRADLRVSHIAQP